MENPVYYVYTLAYPTGEIFYVGKGTGSRISAHEAEARAGLKSKKCNIIRKIWREGGAVIKTRVYEGLSEQEAFEYEKLLIATYGRERLANLTDGGEGASGSHHIAIWNGEPMVKQYRLKAALSIAQLARKANVDQVTVKKAESGEPVNKRKADLIAQVVSQLAGRNLSIQELGITIR